MAKNIFKKNLPNWIRNLCYAVMLLETIVVVITYHKPELFIKIVMQFV